MIEKFALEIFALGFSFIVTIFAWLACLVLSSIFNAPGMGWWELIFVFVICYVLVLADR